MSEIKRSGGTSCIFSCQMMWNWSLCKYSGNNSGISHRNAKNVILARFDTMTVSPPNLNLSVSSLSYFWSPDAIWSCSDHADWVKIPFWRDFRKFAPSHRKFGLFLEYLYYWQLMCHFQHSFHTITMWVCWECIHAKSIWPHICYFSTLFSRFLA